jgi:hypothetical protein
MLAILAASLLGFTGQKTSPEEIQKRLEMPVRISLEPVRLPVALAEIGGQVGVQVRCQPLLQKAIVVIQCDGKPAKELIQWLADEIGAGTTIKDGTLHFGLVDLTEEQASQIQDRDLASVKATLERNLKANKADEPLEPGYAQRLASVCITNLQHDQDEFRRGSMLPYTSTNRTPAYRAAFALLSALGPEILCTESGNHTIDLSSLSNQPEKREQARQILARLNEEQRVWSDAFKPVFKLAGQNPYNGVSIDLLQNSVDISKTPINGFTCRINTLGSGRAVFLDFTSGSETIFDHSSYLPRFRFRKNLVGTPFLPSRGAGIKVELPVRVTAVDRLLRNPREAKFLNSDLSTIRSFADCWKNEPLSFTPVAAVPKLAEKLKLNFAIYLSDSLLFQLLQPIDSDTNTEISGDSLLSLILYGAQVSNLRQRDDWIFNGVGSPDEYLAAQLDRNALGQLLSTALRPGALTTNQAIALVKDNPGLLNLGWMYSRIVRPGFDYLNPINTELLSLIAELTPSQFRGAETSGIPYMSLPKVMQQRVQRLLGYQRRWTRKVTDDEGAPPTLTQVQGSRIFMARTSQVGVLLGDINNDQTVNETNRYSQYLFSDFEFLRGQDPDSAVRQLLARPCWNARLEMTTFKIAIPRKPPIGFSTSHFATDVSLPPLTPRQLANSIEEYFSGGRNEPQSAMK